MNPCTICCHLRTHYLFKNPERFKKALINSGYSVKLYDILITIEKTRKENICFKKSTIA